jgi:serine/threonine protein kinase
LELCVATVDDYIRGDYSGQMPAEVDGLFQMTGGLAYIHSKRFVHRDIKPANVLISPRFALKISDFGFCKTVTNSGSFSTSSGLKGTPAYMAPEYLEMKGKSEDEIKAIRARLSLDIFSLGCVFFSYIKKDRRCHLFQNPKTKDFFSIISNIVKGKKFLEGGE